VRRFTYKLTWPELMRLYRLTLDAPGRNPHPRYNICPTDTIDAVIEEDGKRQLVPMRWGLVPFWWPKPLKELKAATFNARVETIANNPCSEMGVELLKPAADHTLQRWPVSKRVNSSRADADDATLIDPLSGHSPNTSDAGLFA
jgi:putative SOS response-associated peptidase YedK